MERMRNRWLVLGLVAVCLLGAVLKLQYLGTTLSGDFETYVQTAQYLRGEDVIPASPTAIPQRLLKPLAPLLLAAMSTFTDHHTAMLVQSFVFYVLMVGALYMLAYEFFRDKKLAVYFVLLSALSYPILKYGIDIYTETGAVFFYAVTLWLTLKFVRTPSAGLFAANVAVVTVGCLWKEYSIVAGAIFGLSILFHQTLDLRKKIIYAVVYGVAFLAVHVPIQWYVLKSFNFTYVDWYTGGGAMGFSYEFTVKNIVKSTAALIGLAWLLVPAGVLRIPALDDPKRRFLYLALTVPLVGYAWGYISSRLLYVIALPYLLVALEGFRRWSTRAQIAFVALAMFANFAWLVLSYSVKL